MKYLVLSIAILFTGTIISAAEPSAAERLQDISVTIDTGSGQGSGTLFNRKVDGKVVTYVWTAAHVVDGLRKQRTVIINGSPKTVVEFSDATLIQEFRQSGRRIGEARMDARVVRYSDAERGEDLALLEVRQRDFVPEKTSTKFYLKETIPAVGTRLAHVGSLLGQVGANSYTEGVVSQIGRVVEDLGANGVVFDQTTVTAFPGSSGGGVYEASTGDYVGMLVRGAGEQFNLIVPVRRMKEWAKSAKVEWALDPEAKYPNAVELKELPIEDSGVTFNGNNDGKPCKDLPYLFRVTAARVDIIRVNDK